MLIDNKRPNTMVSRGLVSTRRYPLTNGRNRPKAGVQGVYETSSGSPRPAKALRQIDKHATVAIYWR